MFSSTFDLKEDMVYKWADTFLCGIHAAKDVMNQKNKVTKSKQSTQIDEQKLFLRNFFEKLPKMPSHYCRKNTKKCYLEENFQSKADFYNDYKTNAKDKSQKPLSYFVFSEMFENLNLTIFRPKKDQCDTCISFKLKHISDEEYKAHQDSKEKARIAKDSDKELAQSGKAHIFVMDVQSVKLAPATHS